MYKLVAVGGKLRGQEIILTEGENTIGRGHDCDHSLQLDGISKAHLTITVNGENCFVEDLDSSNGTFVNGKLVKKITVKNKDKITLPNIIFQLVYVKENKKIIKKRILKTDEQAIEDFKEVMPTNTLGKIKYKFKHSLMKVVYSFNEQYEWNVLVGIILFLFICVNITLTIGPVLVTSKNLLLGEISARGQQYTNEVARQNAIFLGRGELERIDINFLEDRERNEGVEAYELFDMEGRIVRPANKIDSYINDTFSISSKDFFSSEKNYNEVKINKLSDGEIGISRALLVHNIQTGGLEPVGIIAIRFKPKSLQKIASTNSTAYLEALIMTSIVSVIFFGIFYYMTTRPLEEMKLQIEEVIRGRRKELESKKLFVELNPLRGSVNSILQRVRELQSEDVGEFAEIEEDGTYVSIFFELMQGAQGPIMILNSEKNIEHINSEGEDLTGMRENSASGTSLLDSARDQGFAATVIDLCDQSANNNGTDQNDLYELTGKNYMIHVSALMGKDNFAKAFYVSFVLDE